MHIEPFVDADYPAVTQLFNLAYSEFAKDVDERRFRDGHYPPTCRHAGWTAHAADDEIVGCAEYNQNPTCRAASAFCSDGVSSRIWSCSPRGLISPGSTGLVGETASTL